MPRYTVLRDFGSHLGNHYRGEQLNLPEGELPRGFAGLVERVADPEEPLLPPGYTEADLVPMRAKAVYSRKDIAPASEQTDDVLPEAGLPSSPADGSDRPEPETPPTPASQAEAGYSDKMVRPKAQRSRR